MSNVPKGRGNILTVDMYKKVWARDNGRCRVCGKDEHHCNNLSVRPHPDYPCVPPGVITDENAVYLICIDCFFKTDGKPRF